MQVEKKIDKKNRKITLIGKLNFVSKIFDLKRKIPKKQKSKIFIFVIKFPKIKLIGKKPKVRFVKSVGFIFIFFLVLIIIEPQKLF